MTPFSHRIASRTSLRTIAFLSPSRGAISGVSTHTNLIFSSALAEEFRLLHFQVGSEGRGETKVHKLFRLAISPLEFALFILRRDPDIVHLNPSRTRKAFWRDGVYFAIAKLLRQRVVYQVHGGAEPDQFFRGNLLRRAIARRLLLSADAVVLLSQIERDAYCNFEPRLRPTIIPNAIDPTGVMQADTRRAVGNHPLRLAYLGRLVESKGLFESVEALRILRNRGIHTHLSIAGIGPDETRLRALVARLQLNDSVEFLGPLFGADRDRMWREADIFVFPTFFEGLPYALLESMAAGAVPVTSPTGAIPELIQSEVNGLLVPPGRPAALADALGRLDADRESIARMASAGRDLILKRYTVDRLAEDLRQLYSRVCEAG